MKRKGWKAKKKAKASARRKDTDSKGISRRTTKELRTMARKVRKSASMKALRAECLDTDPECQHCGSKKELEVHHIEFLHKQLRRLNITSDRRLEKFYDEVFDINNVVTLCHNCHLAIHREPGVNR